MMRVVKYIPNRMIGFVKDSCGGSDVYFHLGDFDPKGPYLDHVCPNQALNFNWGSPPPILGESVDVTFRNVHTTTGKAPKAHRVIRKEAPVHLCGVVESFDPRKGYGFVRGGDGVIYYLHWSEVLDQHMLYAGSLVMFFHGSRHGRPRAIHVHTCGKP